MSEMETERVHKLSELESLQQDIPHADPGSLDLLDELPAGETDFAAAPSEVLRWLFEAFRLEVRYHKPSNWTNCHVALGDQDMDRLAADSAKLVRSTNSTGNASSGKRSLLVRAPGRSPHLPYANRVPVIACSTIRLAAHTSRMTCAPRCARGSRRIPSASRR